MPAGAPAAAAYELADMRVVSDVPLGQLEPFASPDGPPDQSEGPAPTAFDGGRQVYAGPALVGGRPLEVESWRGRGGYLLKIEGAGAFEVRDDGTYIGRRQPFEGEQPDDDLVAALLGPCLLLSLALRGIYCLHAAAAGTPRSVVGVAGESGFGKSTLAAALAATPGWRLIADDLLPVRVGGDTARALPRFPQPSLAPQDQWRLAEPERVDLAVVYILDPGGETVEVRALSPRQAALTLVGQTVAARLFDAGLQGAHLEFCSQVSRRLAVRGLSYPQRPQALPQMTAAILADLAEISPPRVPLGSGTRSFRSADPRRPGSRRRR